MLIKKDSLCNNAAPLIFSNISDNKVCIPINTTIGTSHVISNDSNSMNEIILTAGDNRSTPLIHK